MNARTTMSAKGQVVIPKDVRDRLGLASGQPFDVLDTAGGIELRPIKVEGISVDEAVRRLRQIVVYDGPRIDEADWQRGIDDVVRAKWSHRGE